MWDFRIPHYNVLVSHRTIFNHILYRCIFVFKLNYRTSKRDIDMIESYRDIIIEDKDGLRTNAFLSYGAAKAVIHAKSRVKTRESLRTELKVTVLPNGMVTVNKRELSSREMMQLSTKAMDTIHKALAIASKTCVPTSVELTTREVSKVISVNRIDFTI